MEAYVRPIRQAVLTALKARIDPQLVYVIEKSLIDSGRVHSLHDGFVIKRAVDMDARDPELSSEEKIAYYQALQHLFGLNERSPHLAYHVLASDFNTHPRKGTELQRLLPLVTLKELLAQDQPPAFATMLRYFYEATQGAAFLIEHNLRLTDLSLENIAITRDGDSGMFFDYSGLRTADYKGITYVTRREYLPPERESNPQPVAITEANMVYELGRTLGILCYRYKQTKLNALTQSMSNTNPAQRPTLKQIESSLGQIMAQI